MRFRSAAPNFGSGLLSIRRLWHLAALSALYASGKSGGGVLALHFPKLLKSHLAFWNAIYCKAIVRRVSKTGEVVCNYPMRRVIGRIYAGRPRFGKTHAYRSCCIFEELFHEADLHEDELCFGVVENAPELVRGLGKGFHNIESDTKC
jgi:hypothetical protein